MTDKNLYRQTSKLDVIITGKALIPYYVPKNIHIICKPRKICLKCQAYKDQNFLTIKPDDVNLIKFIGISDDHIRSVIVNAFNIRSRCEFKFDIQSVYTVEEIYFQLDNEDSSGQIGFVIDLKLETNAPYTITAKVVPEPKQQKISYIVTSAEPRKIMLDHFKMTKTRSKILTIFQPKEESVEYIYKFLEELYDIYAHNITKIYNRFDLHMAIDLVFHSPLSFYLGNDYIHKGWGDVMIIGDTRCGKGYVSENLIKYYRTGEVISGENASFAGLVGGVQQINSRWIITWGKIPLNNKSLVIIDESGEMDPKDFSRLSRIRSEGIAEIVKIQTQRTTAKTRLIFLTNPKHRLISSYSFGIESIFDIVSNSEDIARFDYVLIVAQNEVNIEDINKNREKKSNPYSKMDPTLVQWIWSRTADQIYFTAEAITEVLQQAIRFGHTYSSQIPLVQGENIRVKLAKISVSIAGRLFSTDKTNEKILVKPVHVQCAGVFLNLIYKKKASGYYYYSEIQKANREIKERKKLLKYLQSYPQKKHVLDYFIQNDYITVKDLSEHINYTKEISREIISKLLFHKCLKKKFSFYVKNKCFIDFLREEQFN